MKHELVVQIAAKAIIQNDKGEILILREAPTGINNTRVGLWGLVGGRLNHGESFFDGLTREVYEETGLNISYVRPIDISEWRPVIHEIPHQIIAIFVLCKQTSNAVRLSSEHDAFKWVKPGEHHSLEMMEPDSEVIDKLISN